MKKLLLPLAISNISQVSHQSKSVCWILLPSLKAAEVVFASTKQSKYGPVQHVTG